MVFRYDWGIQGIDIPVPPSREGICPFRQPLGWDRLRFGPLGLYDLRRRLGVHPSEPGVFQDYCARFLTANIAWFAGGASTENHHTSATSGFFPEFDAMRQSLPTGMVGNEAGKALNERVRYAVFDLVRDTALCNLQPLSFCFTGNSLGLYVWRHNYGATCRWNHCPGHTSRAPISLCFHILAT